MIHILALNFYFIPLISNQLTKCFGFVQIASLKLQNERENGTEIGNLYI